MFLSLFVFKFLSIVVILRPEAEESQAWILRCAQDDKNLHIVLSHLFAKDYKKIAVPLGAAIFFKSLTFKSFIYIVLAYSYYKIRLKSIFTNIQEVF